MNLEAVFDFHFLKHRADRRVIYFRNIINGGAAVVDEIEEKVNELQKQNRPRG